MSGQNVKRLGWAYAAITFNILAWGLSWINVRAAVPHVGAGQLGALRYLLASAVLLPVWFYRGRPLPQTRDWPALACMGLTGFTLYNLGINFGEETVNAGTGSLLISCVPIMVVLAGVLSGREQVGGRTWLGIGVSMGGVVLTASASEGGLQFNIGTVYIFGAAVAAAIYTFLNKPLLGSYHAIDLTTWAIWIGTLGLLPFGHNLFATVQQAPTSALLHIAFLGLVPAALCYILWSWVQTQLPLSTIMSTVYLIPVVSVGLGWWLLHEQPQGQTLLGGAVTLAGVAIVQAYGRRPTIKA